MFYIYLNIHVYIYIQKTYTCTHTQLHIYIHMCIHLFVYFKIGLPNPRCPYRPRRLSVFETYEKCRSGISKTSTVHSHGGFEWDLGFRECISVRRELHLKARSKPSYSRDWPDYVWGCAHTSCSTSCSLCPHSAPGNSMECLSRLPYVSPTAVCSTRVRNCNVINLRPSQEGASSPASTAFPSRNLSLTLSSRGQLGDAAAAQAGEAVWSWRAWRLSVSLWSPWR